MGKRLGLLAALLIILIIMVVEVTRQDQVRHWFAETPFKQDQLSEKQLPSREALAGRVGQSGVVLEQMMGMSEEQLSLSFGEPERKDPSSYGYEWWIYPLNSHSYLQAGVEEGQVVTMYYTGDELRDPLFEGLPTFERLSAENEFESTVEVKNDQGTFQFQLTEDDIESRPLIPYGDDWLQLYFDIHTKELSTVRLLSTDMLLKQKPYWMTYRGTLPELDPLTREEWQAIEAGEEKQIFDLTNIIRKRHGLDPFTWNEDVRNIAFKHSQDMRVNDYFDHVSPTHGKLDARFIAGEVRFKTAGENIALNYVDGAAAVEGWLNSEGHRVNLLHEGFTELGVGVYEKSYTQNFLTPVD
ncbi:CAP domain-containing protein [Alkalicoccobacillus porphyridii]|uniref:CAP domain-containing protein n=1 Tax=Alkalicoccobacillus porphyridii TaxID=2597270 RepID=A0A553ZXW4_9BACI|nr:CAP domain-containing protein [Alkalicoccobacillus porphyridii]TSB46298.1 hypothetical protein FN960_10830 [Alkalicoccobacillus porphyridii]